MRQFSMKASTSSALSRMTRPNLKAARAPSSMKRYRLRRVTPRCSAASLVLIHRICSLTALSQSAGAPYRTVHRHAIRCSSRFDRGPTAARAGPDRDPTATRRRLDRGEVAQEVPMKRPTRPHPVELR